MFMLTIAIIYAIGAVGFFLFGVLDAVLSRHLRVEWDASPFFWFVVVPLVGGFGWFVFLPMYLYERFRSGGYIN